MVLGHHACCRPGPGLTIGQARPAAPGTAAAACCSRGLVRLGHRWACTCWRPRRSWPPTRWPTQVGGSLLQLPRPAVGLLAIDGPAAAPGSPQAELPCCRRTVRKRGTATTTPCCLTSSRPLQAASWPTCFTRSPVHPPACSGGNAAGSGCLRAAGGVAATAGGRGAAGCVHRWHGERRGPRCRQGGARGAGVGLGLGYVAEGFARGGGRMECAGGGAACCGAGFPYP